MKNYTTLFLLLVSLGVSAATWDGTSAASFDGGIGSSSDPYLISTAEQLAKLADDVTGGNSYSGYYFKLTADIVLNEGVLTNGDVTSGKTFKEWPCIGSYSTESDYKAFKGVFDGDGHTVSGIYINNSNQYVGLFRYAESAIIRNLGVKDSYLYANAYIGAVAGVCNNSTIINCYNEGRIDGYGSYHGGLVGQTMGTTALVANCYNTGMVVGKNNIGGIVGRHGVNSLYQVAISNCYNIGSFKATKTNIAGITAEVGQGCTVTNCYFLNTTATNGIFSNSGIATNVISKTSTEMLSADFLSLLNNGIVDMDGACSWKASDTYPVIDYSTIKNSDPGVVDIFTSASNPTPENGDLRANADSGMITLAWSAAVNGKTIRHYLYLSDNEDYISNLSVSDTSNCYAALSKSDTSFQAQGEFYSMKTYYWRVDEKDSTGQITKGETWSFTPRHLAFRSAEGYGRFATGGRGGKVVYVTNLNSSGAGSLKEALTSGTGPRTVVFSVSGVIKNTSKIVIDDDVTVAGQTAPGKGICITSAPVGLGNNNICRFVRVRIGSGATYDGLGMGYANHSILDHASISWTIDEAFSSRGAKNITLQRTMIAEALNIAGHEDKAEGAKHGYAATISGDIGTFHHNLLAHNEGRNWSLGGGLDGNGYYAGRLDIFNNVVYNWGGRATDGGAHEVNFVGNYYKEGPATYLHQMLSADLEGLGKGSQSYYYSNNILQNTDGSYACDGTSNTCGRRMTTSNGQIVDWTVFVDEPFFPSYATIESAKDAYKSVLSDVGCNLPLLDDHDQRMISETMAGTYKYVGSVSGSLGLIDSETDCGGLESYPEESRDASFDTDMDGLPDWWEGLYGSNLNSAKDDFSDSNADPDYDGYTALEEYLEWMSVPHYSLSKNQAKEIDLSGYAVAYTKNPQYTQSYVSSDDISLSFSDAKVTVTPKTDFVGISYFDFTVTDSENSSMTRRIGVYVEDSIASDMAASVVEKANSISVYPTTFDRTLNIETKLVESSNVSLVLRDMSGREVMRKTYMLNAGNEQIQMECPSNIASQMYLLEMSDAKTGMKYDVKRVIKK